MKKKRIKRKRKLRVGVKRFLMLILFIVYTIILINVVRDMTLKNYNVRCYNNINFTEVNNKLLSNMIGKAIKTSENIVKDEEIAEEVKKETKKNVVKKSTNKGMSYRLTYYYPNDGMSSGTVTASGKSVKDFQVNENGWYTYQGKLVVATASSRLLKYSKYKNSTQKTYKLYDELSLTIKGKEYKAIVLDACGACMTSAKIDLFVKDKKSGIDTKISVKEV